MAVYIVTYDLNTPGKDYATLLTTIRRYSYCYALKSAFFIDTAEKAAEIRGRLTKLIDKNDSLYVIVLQKHWAANRTMACTKWLQDAKRTWG